MTKTMKITYTALFAAIATVLMQFEFPVPFMPPFLKIDFSGAAILIGAFIFGIGPGIAMALIKDLIRATMTQTGGSGELQDFILMVVFIPFYSKVMLMPLEAIFGACAAVNPYISGMGTYLLIGVLPFNILKGAAITMITMLVYKKLSVFIKSKQFNLHHTQPAK